MLKKFIIAVALIFTFVTGLFPAYPYSTSIIANAEDSTFEADTPSAWAKETVTKYISQSKVPENLQKNLKRPITIGEYAELNYNINLGTWDDELFKRIQVVDSSIRGTYPDYIKKAFITGFLDNAGELDKTMTREEAASRLITVNTDLSHTDFYLNITDYNNISIDRMDAVAAVIEKGLIPVINNNFSPKSPFTVEQAIAGMKDLQADYILGLFPLSEFRDANAIIVKKNSVSLNFSEDRNSEDYIYTYVSPRLDDLEITGEHQIFDVGYMIIELNGADFDVSYTLKNNICNVKNFDCQKQPTYDMENYKSEPRELEAAEQVNLEVQPDAIHKELYPEVDAILEKTIKPGMSVKDKIKTIHDYVAENITYSGDDDFFNAESALEAISTKKGVCAHYSSLFYFLCKRALVPVRVLEGECLTGRHMWNLVFVDNQWLHVDVTWDDSKNKVIYDYYLKPMEYMMKTHCWKGFAYPAPEKHPRIDGMKIKNTMEFRIFLLQQISAGLPDSIKFKLLNKNIDKDYRFLGFHIAYNTYNLKYDAKSDTYILKH